MRKRFCDDFKNINPQTLLDCIVQTATMETSNRPKPPRRSQSEAASVELMVAVEFLRGTLRAPSFSCGAERGKRIFKEKTSVFSLNAFFRLFLSRNRNRQ